MARILIVDDEPAVVQLMRFILERAGHTVLEADDGQQALKVLGIDPPDPSALLPDLVIMDVMMPVMDGYTASIAIRNDPRAAKIPLLVVTARSEMRELFISMPGVAAFFKKPFDPKDLREAVAKALARK